MKFPQLFKKVFRATAIFVTITAGITLLDIAISGSLYHPLTYLYKIISWGSCRSLSSNNCNNLSSKQNSTVIGKNGMVVTSHHEASRIGLQILKQGGNAIDAAVAIGYALAVVDPCCGNLGGGGFMLIRLKSGKEIVVDFRETAPLAANSTMFLDKNDKIIPQKSTEGYLASAVPGTVKGLNYALSKYGIMTRQQVISPAIGLAEKGFLLTKGDVKTLQTHRRKLNKPNVATIFLKNGKTFYQVGDRLVQKNLAKTLKLINVKGDNAFYQGEIAQKIVKASQQNQGILSLKDFADYTIIEREPMRCTYRGYEVISTPPPGGGTTLCQMLNILEGYNLRQSGFHTAESLHPILSAMLYAYSDRNTYLGDPDFVKIPLQKLLSQDYAEQIQRRIPQKQAIPTPKIIKGSELKKGMNTTHYSVVDAEGNAVAVTYTINSNFGAGVIALDTGFFLNNEMDDFTSKPGVGNQFGLIQGTANIIEPQKRPLSSMSPTIISDKGKLFLITGSPGGSTIPSTVLQVITNIIDYQMGLDEAVNAPRIHYQGLPDIVLTEPYALEEKAVQDLLGKGYKILPIFNWGAAESIRVKNQEYIGINERRKINGQARGF